MYCDDPSRVSTITRLYCQVYSICCDSQTKQLICATDTALEFFDYDTFKKVSMYRPHSDWRPKICIQPYTRNMIVSDYYTNGKIHVIDLESREKLFFIEKENISGVCCDKKGNILIADTCNNRVQVLNEYGRYMTEFGIGKHKYIDDVHVHDSMKQVLVAEYITNQVSIWNYDLCNQSFCIASIPTNDTCKSVYTNPLNQHAIIIATLHGICIYDNRKYQLIQKINFSEHYIYDICVNEINGDLLMADYNHIKQFSMLNL